MDTGIFFAAFSKNDTHHVEAVGLLECALLGKCGTIYSSDYIFDETVTLARVRTHNYEITSKIGDMIKNSSRIRLLRVDEDIFNKAWDIFGKYHNKELSFTDCTSIALVKTQKIDMIFSFDLHFDGILNRINSIHDLSTGVHPKKRTIN